MSLLSVFYALSGVPGLAEQLSLIPNLLSLTLTVKSLREGVNYLVIFPFSTEVTSVSHKS